MKLIHFDRECDTEYSVGARFHTNLNYIKEAARSIHNLVKAKESIILVCRGTSGTILAGGVGYILEKRGHVVTISVSRKGISHHDYNMSGLSNGGTIVVIDDFISSGTTIELILKDLDLNVQVPVYPILCVSNFYNEDYVNSRIPDSISKILSRFNTVLCNKLK